jgi:hypothetical protein
MDWFERLFHISPDGGNGYFEWLIVVVIVLAVTYPLRRRLRRFASPALGRFRPARRERMRSASRPRV